MDIEKGNLEIIFLKIPYYKILTKTHVGGLGHNYKHVDKNLYMQYSQSVFPCCSEDERENNYLKLIQDMKDNTENSPGIFRFIMKIADRLLTYDGNEIICKFDELLRWREISFPLGQDFFTCAFLAKHDLERGYRTKNFSWLPIIRSDDDRLHNILKRGMAENHFHLNGSTKIFELNWICLMNLIDGRMHDFKKITEALQSHHTDRVKRDGGRESFYAECQRAALYRVYLFGVLKRRRSLIEQAEDLLNKVEKGKTMEEVVAEIQELIILTKYIYGARVDGSSILDYAFEKDMTDSNDRECCLLTGERRFLYECYKASVCRTFTEYQKNLFYVYLAIRTHFRGELIQINKQVGFANFSNYQDRKEIFIEGQKEYEDELIRLALNETMRKQNIVSLEARICPKQSAAKLYKAIARSQNIVADTGKSFREDKMIYVLHFPKSRDKEFCLGTARNQNVRQASMKQAKSIAALLERGTKLGGKIRGIDACSSEIYCRPEVFGQVFRYLLDLEFPLAGKGEQRKSRLHATYHAGEDFFDIVDGIRAIDETILFCGLRRGSRIGHGLAMGIDPYEYYKYKGYKIVLPKQVLMDDIAWMLSKADEMGCTMESRLKTELKERYYNLYEEIFRRNVSNKQKASVMDYYQSWKLRGDNPYTYCLEEGEFLQRMKRRSIRRADRYEFNDRVPDNLRKVECYRNLYHAYHFNKQVREVGDERTEFKMDQRYADIVCQLQEKMIQKLVKIGIGVETNPSSNYLIGTIQRYEEHPILRFNARKLKETEKNMSLNVSVNTDDQGVFDTLLENEYALMTLALKKAKDEKGRTIYDIEDIYEWIDYVRKMGVEQVFN
ncbi:MAG: hypothetical protein HFG89_04585 [Dorea sp.]|jgi:adenosine deaminase|nr:hypothetical protein [Dorea sp.]